MIIKYSIFIFKTDPPLKNLILVAHQVANESDG